METTRSTIYRIAFWTLIISCVGFGVGSKTKTIAQLTGDRLSPAITANRNASFTLELKERAVGIGSGKVTEGRFIYAERADGSTVRVNLDDSGNWIMRRIEAFAEGKVVVAGDVVSAVSTTYYSPQQIEAHKRIPHDPTCETHPQAGPNQSKYRMVGSDTLLGMHVLKHVEESADHSIEIWESPDCNCQPILQRFVWKNPDGTTQATNYTIATSITLGEPASLLFEVPPSYAEKPPSVVLAEVTEKLKGRDLPAQWKLERVDQQYYESQVNRPKK